MGSWNNTCNVSNLSICCGKPVRVLFLAMSHGAMQPENKKTLIGTENNFAKERCYSTDFWHPYNVAIKAEYADYGRVSDLKSPLETLSFHHILDRNLIPVEQGENQYHDPPSTVGMNWEQIWNVVQEGRLRIRNDYNRPAPLVGVLILEDVWKLLTKESAQKIKQVNSALDKSLEFLEANKTKTDPFYLHTFDETNEAMRSLFRYGSCGETGILKDQFSFIRDEIFNKTFERKSLEVNKFIRSLAETLTAQSAYERMRKTWHPGTGMGSQNTDFNRMREFYSGLVEIAEAEQKEEEEHYS